MKMSLKMYVKLCVTLKKKKTKVVKHASYDFNWYESKYFKTKWRQYETYQNNVQLIATISLNPKKAKSQNENPFGNTKQKHKYNIFPRSPHSSPSF